MGASECTTKGGTASGTCATSFGVCCVFSISCGGSSSANNSYAIFSSYSTSTDDDPCTYTFCKTNTDVCKLRIDFDTMVLSAPRTMTSTQVYTDGAFVGDCGTDSLTISNPGGPIPPTICGYNTGQHMFVPASDSCNQVNIDIDTGSTTTTRQWQIKVTQYECDNMMAPEQDCLQYLTASTGTIASFNFDTTATSSVATSQTHLSNQYYSICIRRARGYCSLCFSPEITSTTTTNAASYGLSGGASGPAQQSAVGSSCSGITTINPTAGSQVGKGDYLEIAGLQDGTGSSTAAGSATVPGSVESTGMPQLEEPRPLMQQPVLMQLLSKLVFILTMMKPLLLLVMLLHLILTNVKIVPLPQILEEATRDSIWPTGKTHARFHNKRKFSFLTHLVLHKLELKC